MVSQLTLKIGKRDSLFFRKRTGDSNGYRKETRDFSEAILEAGREKYKRNLDRVTKALGHFSEADICDPDGRVVMAERILEALHLDSYKPE